MCIAGVPAYSVDMKSPRKVFPVTLHYLVDVKLRH